jgi:hypothetical protein
MNVGDFFIHKDRIKNNECEYLLSWDVVDRKHYRHPEVLFNKLEHVTVPKNVLDS